MPLYELWCQKCENLITVRARYEERPTNCEECTGPLLAKISVPGPYTINGNNSASSPSRYSTKKTKD